MVAKKKNVDSIVATAPKISEAEPLLTIIESEKVKTSNVAKTMPDKKNKRKDTVRANSPARDDSGRLGRIKLPSLRGTTCPSVANERRWKKSSSSSTASNVKGSDLEQSGDLAGRSDSLKSSKKIILKRHHKIMMASFGTLITLLALTGLIGGGAYAHQAMYENKVFPGVVVWGEDVGGKSMAEVQQQISEKVKGYKITIKGPDQDYTASSTDLGVIFNSETMALGAFSRGRTDSAIEDYLTRARLLGTRISWAPWQKLIRANDLTISPSYTVDEAKFNEYVTKIADNIKITAQDSQVNVSAGQVQLKPAIYGREVKIEELKKQVRESIAGFNSEEIAVETVQVKPAIIDDAAQEVMIQAQNVMKRPVVLTYNGVEYRPNQETVASWISFVKNAGDEKYTLVVDPTKMKSYFDFLGTKVNIYAVPRKIRVENGVKETEIQPGANGTLIDTALLGKTIADLLPNQASVTTAIPTYVAQYKTEYERVIIADWDKYIDINLSTQTMTACEKGGVNCRQWLVTTGDDNHATPTGTFLVLGRNANFYMHDAEYTYNVHVDHATWFTSAGHAIHDASWRNGVFGGQDYHWNGSHGCINSPDDAGVFIYNWAAVGTPVIIHY